MYTPLDTNRVLDATRYRQTLFVTAPGCTAAGRALTIMYSGSPPFLVACSHEEPKMIKLVLSFAVVFVIATFPATWLLMLFLGNVGVNVGYWGALPLGILASSLIGGASASTY